MAGNRYTPELKAAALKLGARGATYTEIRKQFPIAKSTLSLWFNGVNKGRGKDKKYMSAALARARVRAQETISKNKQLRIAGAHTKAEKVARTLSLTNTNLCKALIAMLYWAEGTKSDHAVTIFANSDPVLARFYLELLRAAFPLDERKVRVRLHLHHYHDKKVALRFWSRLLNVPGSQFGKIYVKKRSTRKKFRENFRGICFVIYHDISVRRELLALGFLLAEQKSSRS